MKVMTRVEFLKMPEGTVFQKYELICVGELCVKGETILNGIDFWFTPLTTVFDEYDVALYEEDYSKSIPMEFDSSVRDGMYDESQLFAVWTHDDVRGLIGALSATPSSEGK